MKGTVRHKLQRHPETRKKSPGNKERQSPAKPKGEMMETRHEGGAKTEAA
jgi:hypothetical protein